MPQKQSRFRAITFELIALALLIFLALFFANKIWTNPQSANNKITTVPVSPEVSLSPLTSNVPENKLTPSPEIKDKEKITPEASALFVTLNLQGPKENISYKISTSQKITVLEAMKIAEKQGLVLKSKDYGAPLGILIEGINGINNDPKTQKYWTLYVNNKMSQVGVSSTMVSPGDVITWKHENTTL